MREAHPMQERSSPFDLHHGYNNIPDNISPPSYDEVMKIEATRSCFDPRGWSLRSWLICAACVVVIIVAVVVGAVEGTKNNKYPDYSKLTYSLVDTYSGTSFFDKFEYYTATDPTDGFVQYVDSATASQYNLTYASETSAVLRVDTSLTGSSSTDTSSSSSSQTTTNNQQSQSQSNQQQSNQQGGFQKRDSTGRMSVRITSTNTYDSGLFVFDVVHAPYGCATWPALWLTDPNNWPEHGEIDVMESNNNGTHGNAMTLHTSSGCKMNVKRKESGTVKYTNCLNTANDNSGCSVTGAKATYGEAFNNNGGGVYAMELRDAGIRVWMFGRDDIPSDLSNSSTPDPSSWGEALADFPSTNCDISTHFKNQSIIANIDICGDLAGATSMYTDLYDCPDTCTTWAATSAANFTNAYWEFNSFKVYQSI